jgi:hypothetical protein
VCRSQHEQGQGRNEEPLRSKGTLFSSWRRNSWKCLGFPAPSRQMSAWRNRGELKQPTGGHNTPEMIPGQPKAGKTNRGIRCVSHSELTASTWHVSGTQNRHCSQNLTWRNVNTTVPELHCSQRNSCDFNLGPQNYSDDLFPHYRKIMS